MTKLWPMRCGQLSDHALHFPSPLPGWTVAMMAGTKAAIVVHEVEGTY